MPSPARSSGPLRRRRPQGTRKSPGCEVGRSTSFITASPARKSVRPGVCVAVENTECSAPRLMSPSITTVR